MAKAPEKADSLEGQNQLATSAPGDLEAHQGGLLPTSVAGRTLLPSPIASAISLWTRSTGLALRVGTVISGYGLGAAKATTLSSLELGRGIIEGILHRAGNEAFLRSNTELGRADAETVMEKSLESLHTAMSQVVFWTTAGFHLTGTTISTISEVSQLTLSYLDSILGSTESSRAIASIITLIRREFSNPATGQLGERVGVFDLIVGMVGLAYFQRCAWELIDEENCRLQVEETLWDVVIVNDEEMMDYSKVHNGKRQGDEVADGPNEEVIKTIQQHGAEESSDGEDDLPETRLKQQIMRTLPAGSKVSITTETKTTKTITVDISGTQPNALALPAGVELIEETRLLPASSNESQRLSSDQFSHGSSPSDATYRVVYRVSKNKLRGTEMAREAEEDEVPRFVEQIHDIDSDDSVDDAAISDDEDKDIPPSPPPKSPPRMQQESSSETLHRAAGAQARASRSIQGRQQSPIQTRKGGADRPSHGPLPKQSPETSANQKRPRMPVSPPTSSSSTDHTRKKQQSMQSMSKLLSRKTKVDTTPPNSTKSTSEKKSGLRNALRRGSSSTLSSLVTKDGKDAVPSNAPISKGKQPVKDHRQGPPYLKAPPAAAKQHLSIPGRDSSLVPRREVPRSPQGGTYRIPLTSRALAEYEAGGAIPRSPSRASLISVHERKRDSLVSQTDTFSLRYAENLQNVSPTYVARHSSMAKSRPEREFVDKQQPPTSPSRNQPRVGAHLYSPSIYTLRTTNSQTSLVPYYQRSPFGDAQALSTLRRTGTIDTIFPRFHILRNITRFMRFSSASYGSNFLKVFGISKTMPPSLRAVDDTHYELRMFAHHTQSRPQSILLSSFVDAQGGSDSSGSTETGVPLVHYISLDDESKAVVLACRGTLGFEDVLTDMTCDYDDLVWRGKSYKVHKGVHASARRLLYGGDGRVLVTIKAALESNPDYGLVLCGHSLGGAVTALLGVMLSEPLDGGTSFVTSDEPHSRLLPSVTPKNTQSHVCLPSGRPIHVYAYGPPSTMSPSLRRATRGLITSVVHGQDLVPYLSLGVLHDFQAVALAFKADKGEAKQEIKQKVWEALQGGLMDKWRGGTSKKKDGHVSEEDAEWAYAAFKTLRANMLSNKLLPPGEVFVVETEKVLRRDAFVRPGEDRDRDGKHDASGGKDKAQKAHKYVGRPARRIVLKYVRDVETRFSEIRFGATMLTDHNPARYENALDGLRFGVVDP